MDENGDGEISRAEFVTAFEEENNLMQGLDVPKSACFELFDEWDADGSGTLSFAELRKILSKRPSAAPSPRPRRGRNFGPEPRMCYASAHAGERKNDDRRGGQPISP